MALLLELRPEGLYCAAGGFHIDPGQPVSRAVITHAHGDHARPGSAHYWGAERGLGLLRERLGAGAGITALAYGETLQLGSVRLSLHSAGHVLGSAQVRLEAGGEVWVVSGDYKRDADPSCDPFEVVRCDSFVTEATFAQPDFSWPDPTGVAADIHAWWQDCKRGGKAAVLCCYALGKAQRILAELARFGGETVYLHPAMTRLVKLYRLAGIHMPPTASVDNQVKHFDWRGRLVLAPPGVARTAWLRRYRPASLGFASGWMQGPDAARQAGWDRGFVLSDHADWPSLLRTVEESGARRVLTMHGHCEALVRVLRERGVDAFPLRDSAAAAA